MNKKYNEGGRKKTFKMKKAFNLFFGKSALDKFLEKGDEIGTTFDLFKKKIKGTGPGYQKNGDFISASQYDHMM